MRSSAHATDMHKMGALEEAAEWVAAVTGAPPPDLRRAALLSFQAWLKSGELLCELVNRIKPGAHVRVEQRCGVVTVRLGAVPEHLHQGNGRNGCNRSTFIRPPPAAPSCRVTLVRRPLQNP